MALTREQIDEIKKELECNAEKFILANNLINVVEGELLCYISDALRAQFGVESYNTARHRMNAINLLKKIVDKLSPIYKPAPRRLIVNGTDADQELLEYYEKSMSINSKMKWATANSVFNKGTFLQPVVHEGKPSLRVLTKNHFYVRTDDQVDEMNPTELIIFKNFDRHKMGFTYFSKDNIYIIDKDGNRDLAAEEAFNVRDNENPLKSLPGIYWNRSQSKLFPPPSEDMFTMTVLIPILLTDLNYAQMFQCFSMIYMTNADKETKVVFAPNAVLQIGKDRTSEGDVSIGTITPSVDTNGALTNIQSQISMWLNSLGIRPGSIGTLTMDSFASGISKLIDEMDTVELRQELVVETAEIEDKFWNYVMHVFHPWAVDAGLLETKQKFSPGAQVQTNFTDQVPSSGRGQLVRDLKDEVEAKFTTTKRAIQTLNPQLTEAEIQELQNEIALEHANGVSTEVATSENQSPGELDFEREAETGDEDN